MFFLGCGLTVNYAIRLAILGFKKSFTPASNSSPEVKNSILIIGSLFLSIVLSGRLILFLVGEIHEFSLSWFRKMEGGYLLILGRGLFFSKGGSTPNSLYHRIVHANLSSTKSGTGLLSPLSKVEEAEGGSSETFPGYLRQGLFILSNNVRKGPSPLFK